jgi:hypothetical protein
MASIPISSTIAFANDNDRVSPASSPASNYPLIAMQAIEKFAMIVAARPNYRPERPSELALKKPACEHECDKCYMGCAVAAERLAWWEGELAKACGTRAIRQVGNA